MTTFNIEIRNRLDKEMRNKEFTPSDFHDIADKYGQRHKDVTACLHKFYTREQPLLKIVKSTPNPHGGGPVKTYRIVKGACFDVKNSGTIRKEYLAKLTENENRINESQKRLESVMSCWIIPARSSKCSGTGYIAK